MDTLSRLLSLYPMRASLDIRCHFGAPWLIDHPAAAANISPYHLILTGTAWLDTADERGTELHAGDIILFPKGRAHRIHTNEPAQASPARILQEPSMQSPWQHLVNDGQGAITDILCGQFESAPGTLNAMIDALPETVIIRTGNNPVFSALQNLINILRVETENARPGRDVVVSQLASALFALLIRAWLEQSPSASGLYALLAERRLQPALQGILSAPEKNWTLDEMARVCNMSRATLARLFQQVSGTTPANMLMKTRMAQAGAMLRRDGMPVGAVGEAVGYQSEAAFNRVFKRHFGIGPGKYRQGIDAI